MKKFVGVLVVPLFILLVPLGAKLFTKEMNWSGFDFILAWVLMAGAGVAYKLVTWRGGNLPYRAAAGLAVATTFLLVWINLAVGIIGSEDNPANLMYAAVLAIGFLGTIAAQFQPQGMARTLFAMAAAQLLVPVIAVAVWRPDFSPGVAKVFVLNAGFAVLFVGSGLLFRHSARQPAGSGAQVPA